MKSTKLKLANFHRVNHGGLHTQVSFYLKRPLKAFHFEKAFLGSGIKAGTIQIDVSTLSFTFQNTASLTYKLRFKECQQHVLLTCFERAMLIKNSLQTSSLEYGTISLSVSLSNDCTSRVTQI